MEPKSMFPEILCAAWKHQDRAKLRRELALFNDRRSIAERVPHDRRPRLALRVVRRLKTDRP